MWLREAWCCLDLDLADRYPPALVGRFDGECCCVAWPFSCLLDRKVHTKGDSKILVTFSDVVAIADSSTPIAAMALRYPFDFGAYITESPVLKKTRILDGLTNACMLVAKSQGWDTEPFKVAREQLIQRTFNYPFFSLSLRAKSVMLRCPVF